MADFVLQITDWYRQNKRELPWRSTRNPYFVWLSEIILQQTRVDQGTQYYLNFIAAFPTVNDLALADEEHVLKLWQGLGYYSRARNLHASAKQIVTDFGGAFPNSHAEILALKGVGAYTAAAIASICFEAKHAVVDGNVYRVLSRYFGVDEAIDSTAGKKYFQALADSLVPSENPGEYNQAVMEFGAMHCKPKNPSCETCIFSNSCASAFNPELIAARPSKLNKTKQSNRYFSYLVCVENQTTFVVKREKPGIWQNLYEFPLLETETEALEAYPILYSSKHILSHQIIHATFYRVPKIALNPFENTAVSLTELHQLPTHRLTEKFLAHAELHHLFEK